MSVHTYRLFDLFTSGSLQCYKIIAIIFTFQNLQTFPEIEITVLRTPLIVINEFIYNPLWRMLLYVGVVLNMKYRMQRLNIPTPKILFCAMNWMCRIFITAPSDVEGNLQYKKLPSNDLEQILVVACCLLKNC